MRRRKLVNRSFYWNVHAMTTNKLVVCGTKPCTVKAMQAWLNKHPGLIARWKVPNNK